MRRIAFLSAGVAALAAGVLAVPLATAAPQHSRSHAHKHRASASPPVVRTVFVGYAPSYSSYAAHNHVLTSQLSNPRVPPIYFVPAVSPNAPRFSFNGSPEEPGWEWQRVSFQQLVGEVRARREALEAQKAP